MFSLKSICLVASLGSIGPIAAFAAGQAVIHVPAGGDLQAAIDSAQLGDIVTLEPGAAYTGNFVLRKKPGKEFLTIRTSGPGLRPGTRVTPAEARSFAKIIAPNDLPAVATDAGAHHYRLADLELYAAGNVYTTGIVALGSGTATQISDQAFHIELDRLYVHGHPEVGGKVGVILNSVSTVVKNCWISDFKHRTQDTQAVTGFNGPGPFTIVNNYLEGAAENVLFGAAIPKIDGLIPSDIVIRHNHFRKPPEWMSLAAPNGTTPLWSVKNILEFKKGRRVLVEENLLENNWVGADQYGFAIVLTVRTDNGATPWAALEDIRIVRNIIRNSGSGVNLSARDGNFGGTAGRITFKENLFYGIDAQKWGRPQFYASATWFDGRSRMFQILQGPPDVAIDHNTLIQETSTGGGPWSLMLDPHTAAGKLDRFQFTNNIATYGVKGTSTAEGNPTQAFYAPDSTFSKNVLIGRAEANYPDGNYFPSERAGVGFSSEATADFRLASGTPYKSAAADGRDLGADISAVEDALKPLVLVPIKVFCAMPGTRVGKLAVTVISDASFDAPSLVSTLTLVLSVAGSELRPASCDTAGKVNGDGLRDLVCQFDAPLLLLRNGDEQATLKGRTIQGGLLEGTGRVSVVHSRYTSW